MTAIKRGACNNDNAASFAVKDLWHWHCDLKSTL